MKKLLSATLSLMLLLGLTSVAAACGSGSVDSSTGTPQESSSTTPEKATLKMVETEKALMLGEECTLGITYTGEDVDLIEWVSDNTTVATVSDGVVTGMNEGSAKITASVGELSASCTVIVSANGYSPKLVFENEIRTEETTKRGGQINFAASVEFNGKSYDDAVITYTVVNPTAGTIDENGVFTAGTETGVTTEINISAAWRGFETPLLSKTISVTIVSVNSITLNDGELNAVENRISLYTLDSFAGVEYATSKVLNNVSITEDGVAFSGEYNVSIVEGSNVGTYGGEAVAFEWNENSGEISAVACGTAQFKVSFVDSFGVEYAQIFHIDVQAPLADYEGILPYFSIADGQYYNEMQGTMISLSTLFGENESVVKATQGERALTVTDGKVYGVVSSNTTEKGVAEITVYTDKAGYNVNLETYAGVIDDLNDFAAYFSTSFDETQSGVINSGYYVVVKDLVAPTQEIIVSHKTAGEGGFSGILDGNGHTVSFTLKADCEDTEWITGYGLFGSKLYNGTTIKNIAFDGVTLSGTNIGGLLAGNTAENAVITLENVYLEVANASYTTYSNMLTGVASGTGTVFVLNNTILETGAGHGSESYYQVGVFHGSGVDATSFNCSNAYVIADAPLSNKADYSGENGEAELKIDNLRVYEEYADLKEANDYSEFKSPCWDCTKGMPVWHSLVAAFNDKWNGQAVVHSSLDNTVILPDDMFEQGETLAFVTDVSGMVTYYADGVWSNGLQLTDAQMKENAPIVRTVLIEGSLGTKYAVDLVSYAGIINELADFETFFSTNTEEGQNAKVVYGYYLVVEDLIAPTQTVVMSHKEGGGFGGVLDGNGHTVSFTLTADCDTADWINGYGLFGKMLLGNVIIKNIAFDDITITGTNLGGLLAGNTEDAALITLENVYIQAANISTCAYTNLLSGTSSGSAASYALRNTVIEVMDGHGKNSYYQIGVLHGSGVDDTSFNFSNAYIISDIAMSNKADYSGENGTSATKFNGMYIYEGYADIKERDFSMFNETYWDCTKGCPVWHSLADAFVVAWSGGNILYSTADGTVVLPEGLLKELEILLKVYDAAGNIYYENGAWKDSLKLSDEEINASQKKEYVVTVEGNAGTKYDVTLIACAGVIDELDDFVTFFSTCTDAEQAAKTVKGYYIVAKDIIAPTQTITMLHKKNGGGFAGVLDGNGHTVSFTMTADCDTGSWINGYGLFGQMLFSGATIKNIAFDNITLTGTNIGGLFAGNTGDAARITFENVYVKAANLSEGAYTNLFTGTASGSATTFVMKNVVVEVMADHGKNNYYQVGVIHGSGVDATSFVCENTYLITTVQLNNKNTSYSGENGSADTKFMGMFIYESYDAMKNANHNYSGFGELWDTTSGYPVWAND